MSAGLNPAVQVSADSPPQIILDSDGDRIFIKHRNWMVTSLARNPNQNPLQVTHTLNHGSNYGSGVIAGGNNLRSQNSVRAFYSGKSETGAWELLTMYPET